MATRFTRVTVVGDDRQVDVSLPAQQPVVTLVPQLCALLSLRKDPPLGPWTLSAVSQGILNPQHSLDEAGITDAETLYLAPPPEAPEPPFVEDVVDEAAARLDGARTVREGMEWAGAARVTGCCALAASGFLVLALVIHAAATNRGGAALALAVRGGAALALAVAGAIALGLAFAFRDRGGVFLAVAAVPTLALAGLAATQAGGGETPSRITITAAGAGLGLTAFRLAGKRWLGFSIAGGMLVVSAAIAEVLVAIGLRADRTAAVLVVFVLFAAGITPYLAVSHSRLVGMLRAEEKAERVPRDTLDSSVKAGQDILTGAVAGIAVVASAVTATLILSSGVAAPLLGAVTALAFALRSRAFTRTGQVLPMLAVPTAGALATAIALPTWLTLPTPGALWLTALALLAIAITPLALGATHLNEVAAARLRRLSDATEAAAIILTVPLALATLNTFAWIRDLVS